MEKSQKTKILREEYPLNLMKAMEAAKTHFEFIADTPTKDQIEGLEYALTQLTERERQILFLRYQERKTLREIGEIIGVTLERIRSQESRAIFRLAKPPRHTRITRRRPVTAASTTRCSTTSSKLCSTVSRLPSISARVLP